MIFGILVVYSEDYLTRSLLEFNKILKLTARKYKLIVVLNNHSLPNKLSCIEASHIDFEFVLGTNRLHEFSGWSEGLDFIKEKYVDYYKESEYVFCNDTFCQHRTYTIFHRFIFSACCSLSFISNRPKIAGEVNSFGKDFEFNHLKFNTWVSSYFFAVNKHAMNLLRFDILPSNQLVSDYLLGGHDEKYFFSDVMDLTLKKHLLHWLFHGGWYKSESLSQSNAESLYYKARSIIAEFSLSSKAHANKIDFVDTYFFIKKINKLRYKIG
ncbi:MAG: hypothetical protein K2V71_09875 [Methylotenera sp.]|nr:hypothetical protein [Methylotenera sp.]